LQPFILLADDLDRPFRAAVAHALQAIEDRAALVEAWRDANATVSQGGFVTLLANARRHMKGEE
jgi:hypothetical protein